MAWDWLGKNWSAVAALIFSGLGFWTNARVVRAQTVMDVAKHHREVWTYYHEHPEYHRLLETDRDIAKEPLTKDEAFFANLALQHLYDAFYASRSWIYRLPQHLPADIRQFFRKPALNAYWQEAKARHARDFVRYVDRCLAEE